MKTIKQEHLEAEITEKKSKFIANVFYVKNREEAEEKIKEIRKKYYDARHNCYAYVISLTDEIIVKSSDDGEPSKTAGAPILNVINGNELSNILIVVTRYFGGILLGTGGLVKAYTNASLEALKKAEYVTEKIGLELKIEINYIDLEKLRYYCQKNDIDIIKIEYKEFIECVLEVTNDEKDKILSNNQDIKFKILKWKILTEKNIRKNIEK